MKHVVELLAEYYTVAFISLVLLAPLFALRSSVLFTRIKLWWIKQPQQTRTYIVQEVTTGLSSILVTACVFGLLTWVFGVTAASIVYLGHLMWVTKSQDRRIRRLEAVNKEMLAAHDMAEEVMRIFNGAGGVKKKSTTATEEVSDA